MYKIIINYSLTILFILTVMSSAKAANTEISPQEIEGTVRVYAEELLDLSEKIPTLIIIDSRIISDRKHGYIEGSISLPDIDTNCKSLAKVIPGKNTPVLFYCNGVKCGRSVKSSKIAIKCGYNEIYWFRGGFEEWKSKMLPFIKS